MQKNAIPSVAPESDDQIISRPFRIISATIHFHLALTDNTALLITASRTPSKKRLALKKITWDHSTILKRASKRNIFTQISGWLNHYINGEFKPPPCPLAPQGTPFQKRVWREVLKIPPGEPITYGDMAEKLATSARAIGMAAAKNPLPLLIPCHRVVGKDSLGGYSAMGGINTKRILLNFEKEKIDHTQPDR
ncbi:methylated-DNA--[protein]-cysteine S-methyltransferase [Magnetococcales bacterium HHB-1]